MQPTFTEQEQNRLYNSIHYGWTAETRIKIDGKNWVITTSKRNSGGISTHCHAVQDEGNGSISFSMFGGDTSESFHLNILPNARCTEKAVQLAHAEGMKQFYAKKEAGELPKLTEDEIVKIGTVLFTDGNGEQRRRAVYEIEGNKYKTVHLDGTRLAVDDFVRPYSKKFGIGVYFKPGDFITLQEINDLIPQAKANMKIQAEKDAIKQQEANKAAEEKRQYLSQFKKADRRTTTDIIKRHIVATWPSVQNVTVKTDSFSGGDSMDVTYHAPERIEELETFVRSFRYGKFDGMTDMYEHNQNKEEIILEGHILQDYKFSSAHFVQCTERPKIAVPGNPLTIAKGGTIRFNKAQNGIEISFPSKPAQETIDKLKANGFRWSRYNSVWYIKDTSYNRHKVAQFGTLPEDTNEGEGDAFDNMVADQTAERIGA